MPRGIPKCEICGQSMPKGQDCGCWGCGSCGQQLRKGEDCGCWVCRCCERYGEMIDYVNLAGTPCCECGHEKGACDCVECPRHCGFLHPVGFVCKPPVVTDEDVTDEDVPF